MTLLVRDEADIVDAQIAFHLHAGVDFVIATDNASSDGTTEILERYERAGHLRLIREPGTTCVRHEWVTRMARLAATEHGADWVINSDADEFWWPRGGSLKDVLAAVPDRYGVVRGAWRHFLPRPDDGDVLRRADDGPPRAPGAPRRQEDDLPRASEGRPPRGDRRRRRDRATTTPRHRGSSRCAPGIRSRSSTSPSAPSSSSSRRRAAAGCGIRHTTPTSHQHPFSTRRSGEGRIEEYLRRPRGGDDATVVRGRRRHARVDTRLRDALRVLRAADGSFAPPDRAGQAARVPPPERRR